ncbi:MAG: caspase family protein [Myxococcota bacterium]
MRHSFQCTVSVIFAVLGLLAVKPAWAQPTPQGAKLMLQHGHTANVSHLQFSRDGRRLVSTAKGDGTFVWDVETGALLHRLRGDQGVDLSDDGRHMVSHDDSTIDLWDARSGRRLQTIPTPCPYTFAPQSSVLVLDGWCPAARSHVGLHEGIRVVLRPDAQRNREAFLSPDGRRLVTRNDETWGTDEGRIAFWRTEPWEAVAELGADHGRFRTLSFSPDGKTVVAGVPTAQGGTRLTVYRSRKGKAKRCIQDDRGGFHTAGFTTDGTRYYTISRQGMRVWDTRRWKLEKAFSVPDGHPRATSVSGDGRLVVVGGAEASRRDHTAQLVDIATGAVRHHFEVPELWASALSYDGSRLALSSGHDILVFDTNTRAPLHRLGSKVQPITSVQHTGSQMLTVSDSAAQIWDWRDGTAHRRFVMKHTELLSASLSADGALLVTEEALTSGGLTNGTVAARDAVTGERIHRFGTGPRFTSADLSPDQRHLVTTSVNRLARWNVTTGELIQSEEPLEDPLSSATFSPDGTSVLVTSRGQDPTRGEVGQSVVYGWAPWRVRYRFEGGALDRQRASFSSDGTRLVTGELGRIEVRRARDGRLLHTLEGRYFATFSPDGKSLATSTGVFDMATGGPRFPFAGPNGAQRAAFSADGTRIASWSANEGIVRVQDHPSGTLVSQFDAGHDLVGLGFASQAHLVATAGDGASTLYEVATGEWKAIFVSFSDGGWAVVDPEGRFDASDDGQVAGAVWVIGGEPYALSQLRDLFYDPGLLAKRLGLRDEPLRPVPTLSTITAPALVERGHLEPNGQLDLRLEDQGGGIGAIFATLNGSDISDAVTQQCPELASGRDCRIDLASLPTWVAQGSNRVQVRAGNAANTVRSRGLLVFTEPNAPREEPDPPDLWVLAVGTSDYAGDQIDLGFAALDAQRFAEAFRLAGARGFSAERTHVRVLATEGTSGVDDAPTRQALDEAFDWLAGSDPFDTVVVFLAGHGVAYADPGGGVDDYFYLLSEASSMNDVRDPTLRARTTFSGSDLADAFTKVPALKRVVVLDTCAAGKVEFPLAASRNLSSDVIRAHARARERTGAWLLAGAAADQVSYEASRFGQGVLTYALLEAMRGPALDGSTLQVARWFGYAEDKVPEYAKDLGGVQRPVVRRGSSGDFIVGVLEASDRASVPIQNLRPVMAHATLQAEGGRLDTLRLSQTLNRYLRDQASRPHAPFVLWDVDPISDTWTISGTYAKAEGLTFQGFVTYLGEKESVEYPLRADALGAEELVRDIARQALLKVAP